MNFKQCHDCFIRNYPKIFTVSLEYIGILCQFSKPDWFLETCKPLEVPMLTNSYIVAIDIDSCGVIIMPTKNILGL